MNVAVLAADSAILRHRTITSLVWVAVITIVFMLPPNELVLWTMLAVALAMTLYWLASARRHFRGPGMIAAGCESPPPSSSPP